MSGRVPLPTLDQLLTTTPRSVRGGYDPERGVSLDQARFFFAPEEHLQWLSDVKDRARASTWTMPADPRALLAELQERNREERSVLEHLERFLMKKLWSGALFATGYGSHDPLDRPPTRILADRWRTLNVNFGASEASVQDLHIAGIQVFDPSRAPANNARAEARRTSSARLRLFYRAWVEENVGKGHTPTRDEDWKAAKAACGNAVSRKAVRELRREMAPADWTRQGRRKQREEPKPA